MKKWICMLLSAAMLLSFAACGEDKTDQPEDDASIQQSGSASNEEGTQQSVPAQMRKRSLRKPS